MNEESQQPTPSSPAQLNGAPDSAPTPTPPRPQMSGEGTQAEPTPVTEVPVGDGQPEAPIVVPIPFPSTTILILTADPKDPTGTVDVPVSKLDAPFPNGASEAEASSPGSTDE